MGFDVYEYLEYFNFPSPRESGESVMSSCPNFSGIHGSGDRHYSWGINKKTGVSNCFACPDSGLSLESLTAKLLEKSCGRKVGFLEAYSWLEERYGIKQPKENAIAKVAEKLLNPTKAFPNSYPESILYPYKGNIHKSLFESRPRFFTKEMCKKWELGFDKLSSRTVIPVRNVKGELAGVISKPVYEDGSPRYLIGLPNIDVATMKLDPKEKMKYKYKKDTTLDLFGAHFLTFEKPLLLVESALDVIWLDQLGYSENFDLGAIMSATPSQNQLDMIAGYSKIYLGLDSDQAGINGSKSIRSKISSLFISIEWGKFGGKDPGDMEPEQIQKALTDKNIFGKGFNLVRTG